MRNKGMQLGALIMGLLIVSISFASTISAQAEHVETNTKTSAGTVNPIVHKHLLPIKTFFLEY